MFSVSFGEQSEIEKKKGKGKVGVEVVEMVMKREKVRKREKTEGPTCRVYAPHFIIDFSYSVPTVSKQSFLLLRAVSVFICHFFLLERENFSARIAGIFTFFFFTVFLFPISFPSSSATQKQKLHHPYTLELSISQKFCHHFPLIISGFFLFWNSFIHQKIKTIYI